MNKDDKLGGLWVNKEKGYMSGTINGERVIIFKNGYKSEEKHPDYIVYKSRPKEETSEDGFLGTIVDDEHLPF